MNALSSHVLSIATALPALGACALFALPAKLARAAALAVALATALVVALACASFSPAAAGMQLIERVAWIPALRVEYSVGVDGLSVLVIALTAILTPLVVLASRAVVDRPRTYFALVLLLETALLGAFTAQSFFLWFLHWELSLVPAFFLVKLWGGSGASRAALGFFLYTLVGSIVLLLAFQALFLATGTFDFAELRALGQSGALGQRLAAWAAPVGLSVAPATLENVAFLAIAAAFFVKTPMWPLHSWLPDTYAEAPAPVSMMLTGALSKLGVYGLLRLALPLFPDAAARLSAPLTVFAVVTIVLGAFAALAQTDLSGIL